MTTVALFCILGPIFGFILKPIPVMSEGMSHFKIENYNLCEELAEHKLTLFIIPKNSNTGVQLVDMNMSLPIPLGNDAKAKFLLEVNTGLTGKYSWTYLIEMEGDYCTMIDRYLGQFWFDIERAFAIMPRSCPIPRGTYHSVNYHMDYEKLKLQTVPLGKMRLTINVAHKLRPEFQGCAKIIISNTSKIDYLMIL